MPKLPRISGKRVVKALSKIGFEVIRIKGSHHFLEHEDGRCTVVPIHGSEIVGPGLLSKILRDCDLTTDEFQNLSK